MPSSGSEDPSECFENELLDEWLAEVETLRQSMGSPLREAYLRGHIYNLREGIAAVGRARKRHRWDLLLEEVIWLARFVASAERAEGEWRMTLADAEIDSWQKCTDELDQEMTKSDEREHLRTAALDSARSQRRINSDAELARLKPEFDRLRQAGHSARNAAIILSKSSHLSPDTLRKRLTKFPSA